MLGRSQASAAILLGLVTTQLAGGNQALAKATVVAGSLGGVVGLGWALVHRARMGTRTGIGLMCGVALIGGTVAAASWNLLMLGVGLFLLGVGGTVSLVWHGAVRRREARRGSPLGTVNGEIDSWTGPSVTVLMVSVAGFGLWSLHAAFGMVTCLVAGTGVIAVWFWPDRPAPERRPGDELIRVDDHAPDPARHPLAELWKDVEFRRQILVNVAVWAAFAAYWWPLALLVRDLGWGGGAALWAAAFGIVRFAAPPVVHAVAVRANGDSYAAARSALRWPVGASLLLATAGLPAMPPALALGVVGLGLLIADSTMVAGLAAVRTEADRGPYQATVNVAVALASTIGITLAGFTIVLLDWFGSCLTGGVLSAIAWFLAAAPGQRRRRAAPERPARPPRAGA